MVPTVTVHNRLFSRYIGAPMRMMLPKNRVRRGTAISGRAGARHSIAATYSTTSSRATVEYDRSADQTPPGLPPDEQHCGGRSRNR